jgi:UDP-N-acetylmuramate dehydrogenase
VCAIRSKKLPDPKVIGNAGSFFQNPIVDQQQYDQLIKRFPNLVSYPETQDKRKLAAGWLIDQCGFKGRRVGPVGVYEKQALVLVNHGDGKATDILNLAKTIQTEVQKNFGIWLEIEPNILS